MFENIIEGIVIGLKFENRFSDCELCISAFASICCARLKTQKGMVILKRYRKTAIIALSLVLASLSLGSLTASSIDTAKDLNHDGKVQTDDFVILRDHLIGKGSNLSANSDFNSDGKVNVIDGCIMKQELLTPTVSDDPKMDPNATAVADFRKGASSLFEASDGWTNGSCFDCGWYASNTSLSNNCLNLTIDRDYSGKYNYSGAEYRTKDFYHYGYYETSMQAIKNDGVVSSFFTYTGPSDNNPWDEIDIEVLGKDTTKVQLNYYTNGQGNHEVMYDLGFDASQGFHTYGFDWQPNSITWYVDGKAIYTAYSNIPKTPGKIMMNVWPGTGVDDWLKPFNGKTPLTAKYQWVTFRDANGGNVTTTSPSTPGTTPTTTTTTQPYNPGEPSSTVMNSNATAVADFRKGASSLFEASDGWTNGSCFDCGWFASNTSLNNNCLNLKIDRDYSGKYHYSGAEYRTKAFYSYGYYETSMKAIKNDGVVSSFFTYTGESDNNPWDEIDIEVLGKDTTKVQLNYYTNGQGNHEYMHNLGFDASQGFHTYGFNWQPNSITWYVDGKSVYTAYNNIPRTAGKIMMNVWPGTGVDDWLKPFNGRTPLTAQYQWVTYNKQ